MSKLWSIYIPGPDEYYAAPSEDAAKQMAERHNKAMREFLSKREGIMRITDDMVHARVVEWPFDSDEHAADIENFDSDVWGIEGGAV